MNEIEKFAKAIDGVHERAYTRGRADMLRLILIELEAQRQVHRHLKEPGYAGVLTNTIRGLRNKLGDEFKKATTTNGRKGEAGDDE